jgi:hypothetical protein
MDGRSGNLFSVWRRGNCQAEFTPGLLPDGCNWAESIVRYSRQVNQRGNLNCERAAASLFGWDANAGFHVQSRTTHSPVSFRMAGLLAKLTFLGAAGTVTGSKYLVEAGGKRLLVDCGIFQGAQELSERNFKPLPVDPKTIDYLVLTHAHLDLTR